jgi:hypothetical protein
MTLRLKALKEQTHIAKYPVQEIVVCKVLFQELLAEATPREERLVLS